MLDDPKMVSMQDLEPVTRSEFRTSIQEVKGLIEDVKRHAGVLHEDLAQKMDFVVECVTPQSDRVTRHEDRLTALEADVDLLKSVVRSRR
jgi:hypothetical protein